MNTSTKTSSIRILAFVAAACVAQAVIPQDAGSANPADQGPVSMLVSLQRPALPETALPPRRCDAIDAFGNPVRPCRG